MSITFTVSTSDFIIVAGRHILTVVASSALIAVQHRWSSFSVVVLDL